MKHEHNGVEIFTCKDSLSGKWYATFKYPGEDEEVNTGAWASDEHTILVYVKSRIESYNAMCSGNFKLNTPAA